MLVYYLKYTEYEILIIHPHKIAFGMIYVLCLKKPQKSGKPATCRQGNFAEIKKVVLKWLCFSLFFTNFNNQ